MAETTDAAKLIELTKDIKITMFTTIDAEGHFVSRPMAPAPGGARRRPVVLRRAGLPRGRADHGEPARRPHPELQRHLDLDRRRRPRSSMDRPRRNELWNTWVEAWLPQGPDDPSVVLIKVDAAHRGVLGHPGRHGGLAAQLRQGQGDRRALRGHRPGDRRPLNEATSTRGTRSSPRPTPASARPRRSRSPSGGWTSASPGTPTPRAPRRRRRRCARHGRKALVAQPGHQRSAELRGGRSTGWPTSWAGWTCSSTTPAPAGPSCWSTPTTTSGGKIMCINLDGAFVCLRQAARRMIKAGNGGRLIAVTSVHEHQPGSAPARTTRPSTGSAG